MNDQDSVCRSSRDRSFRDTDLHFARITPRLLTCVVVSLGFGTINIPIVETTI